MTENISILFGGAEGNNAKFTLLNDILIFKPPNSTWIKLSPKGEIPSKRVSHASCSIGSYYFSIFGGIESNAELSESYLYILDMSPGLTESIWYKMKNKGITPCKRYGHNLIYNKPYLILFGGNNGKKELNDIYVTKFDKCDKNSISEFDVIVWRELDIKKSGPSPRMYFSISICDYGKSKNMVFIYGGRGNNKECYNDLFALSVHRNGIWEWNQVKYNNNNYIPQKRFLHTMVFYYNLLIIFGGKNYNDNLNNMNVEVFNTENNRWELLIPFNYYRHCTWRLGEIIYSYGGFNYNSNEPVHCLIKVEVKKLLKCNENLKKEYEKIQNTTFKKINYKNRTPTISPDPSLRSKTPTKKKSNDNLNINNNNHNRKRSGSLNNKIPMESILEKPIIKLGEISITKKNKITINDFTYNKKTGNIETINEEIKNELLCDKFIKYLLRPEHWITINSKKQSEQPFHFPLAEVSKLISQVKTILEKEPILLKINTPVKIFGDIHGQFIDLMNFFNKWGMPSETNNGDILSNDYLFLGDYVDRGYLSLETICLLFALKIKYPERIHLLRGNHEDLLVNYSFGFRDECINRLDDNPSEEIEEDDPSLFSYINKCFEYLPLAALIDDQIFCLHGGIGANVKKISDINKLKKPIDIIHEAKTINEKMVMDILWSDPTDNDEEKGILPNKERDGNELGIIVKYGPDIVKKFIKENGISYIIRAHECVMDGFERFAGGALVTVFSATDYCGHHKNAGAMIVVNQHMQMIPHLIYPQDGESGKWIDDEEYLKKRPPTPPRVRYNKTNY